LFDKALDLVDGMESVPVVNVADAPISELRRLFVDGTPSTADMAALLVRLERVEASSRALQASRTGVRSTDPDTAADAAAAVRKREGTNLAAFRAGTHKHRLLATYARLADQYGGSEFGVSDDVVAREAGLHRPGVCWWKRSSELRQVGYIEATGAVAVDPDSGKERERCRITDAGRAYLAALGPVE